MNYAENTLQWVIVPFNDSHTVCRLYDNLLSSDVKHVRFGLKCGPYKVLSSIMSNNIRWFQLDVDSTHSQISP